MKNTKRTIMICILAFVMVFGLSACNTSSGETPGTDSSSGGTSTSEGASDSGTGDLPYEGVTLTFWMPPYTADEDQSYWDGRMEVFKEQTGVNVEVTIVPWGDMGAKYLAGFMSGQGPDVFYMVNELMYDVIEAGACLELSPYFSAEEVADQLLWESCIQMGGHYAAPFSSGVSFRGMAFNMDILDAAGVAKAPATWDEVIDAGQKVKAANLCEYPVLYGMSSTNNTAVLNSFLPTLWSAGGDMVNADGTEATLNTPEALAACQYLYGLSYEYSILSPDCTTIDTEGVQNLFREGKTAIAAAEVGYIMDVKDINTAFAFAVTDGKHDMMTFSPVDTMAVNADSNNKDAAIDLLKFLISTDSHVDFRTNNMYPALIRFNASDVPASYDNADIAALMENVGEYTRAMPVAKGIATMTDAMTTNLQLMMMNELTPEAALEAMQNACSAALR